MTDQMLIVAVMLVGSLLLFFWERFPVELVALGVLCTLLLSEVLAPAEAFAVFANEAPLAVAALFVLSDLLLRAGGLAGLTDWFTVLTACSRTAALVALCALAAAASAFINNTPVVAILIPVVVHMTRENGVSSARYLIPLSYAALLGGCCTLIGTSTNLVVHGIARADGLPGFGMFEIGLLGVPLLLGCGTLMVVLAPRVLPDRQTVGSLLTAEQRRARIFQLLVERHSPLVGRRLDQCDFPRAPGVVLLEVRRRAERITSGFDTVRFEPFDRLAVVTGKVNEVPSDPERPDVTLGDRTADELGLEPLSTLPGGVPRR